MILLIITGSIAAYKACDIVRLLQKQGRSVRVIMTAGAQEFISPLTLAALSGHHVYTDLFSLTDEAEMGHIRLAREAEMILIAPASADFLAKMATGRADDLASTVVLATQAPVWVAPAMNPTMYAHAATQANIQTLKQRGVHILPPETGEAACGESGQGRMAEPSTIVDITARPQTLKDQRVLITVGATREPIDPIRFLSNASSGQMGFALATAAAARGAQVVVIQANTTALRPLSPHIRYVTVETAEDMMQAVLAEIKGQRPFNYAVCAAAVADMRLATVSAEKKSKDQLASLSLVPTVDILATIAHLPPAQRPTCVVGFAAQTHDVVDKAREKWQRKGCDVILANLHTPEYPAFDSPDNQLIVMTKSQILTLPRQPKETLAHAVWDCL